jgi:muconolactone delta-isomerase
MHHVATEFLVDMVTTVPAGTSDDDVADMRKWEAARAAELIPQGSLVRLWRPPLAPGRHDDLITAGGIYQELFDIQASAFAHGCERGQATCVITRQALVGP